MDARGILKEWQHFARSLPGTFRKLGEADMAQEQQAGKHCDGIEREWGLRDWTTQKLFLGPSPFLEALRPAGSKSSKLCEGLWTGA